MTDVLLLEALDAKVNKAHVAVADEATCVLAFGTLIECAGIWHLWGRSPKRRGGRVAKYTLKQLLPDTYVQRDATT